jgi:branched-chain amino acid transport system substrate-binding protein
MGLSRRALVWGAATAFAVGCAGGTDGGTTAASDTILIGEYGSLTGSEATFGQSTHNGVMLAVEEINAAGGVNGKKLAVKVYDDQGKTQEAGTAVTPRSSARWRPGCRSPAAAWPSSTACR